MNSALSILVEVAARLVEGYCLHILFCGFGERKIKKKAASCILTISVSLVLGKLISYVSFWDTTFSLGQRILSLVLKAAAVYLIGMLLYRVRMSVRLFVVLVFISFMYGSIQIGNGVSLFFMRGIDELARRMDAVNDQARIHFLVNLMTFLGNVVTIGIPLFSAKFLVKHQKHTLNEKSAKEVAAYMLPVMMGSFASVILHFVFFVINREGNIVDYDTYIGVSLFMSLVFVAIWLAVLYSFKWQQEMMELQEEQTQKRVLENQILQMQNSMMEMESFYEDVRQVKHDMRNQIAVMENLLQKNRMAEKEEISAYFDDMQNTLAYLEKKIHTGNAVSDAVIGSKFHYAEKEIPGICLDAEEFMLTDKIRVRVYDIGIILNNGLDNAIEACKRQQLKRTDENIYIKIKSFWRQNMFFIEIENSFDGVITWGEDGFPCTMKEEKRLHGIGLKNIRRCAVKYKGDIECMVEKDRFILSVMMKG